MNGSTNSDSRYDAFARIRGKILTRILVFYVFIPFSFLSLVVDHE